MNMVTDIYTTPPTCKRTSGRTRDVPSGRTRAYEWTDVRAYIHISMRSLRASKKLKTQDIYLKYIYYILIIIMILIIINIIL